MGECVPWPTDLGCITKREWEAYNPALRSRAVSLAWATLRHLTGGLVGNCPVALRPCSAGCATSSGWLGGPALAPYIRDGQWFNAVCGCQPSVPCHCGPALSQITLPGLAARIDRVYLHGAVLDEFDYRLDNGRLLVAQNGVEWPTCQDLSQPYDGSEAFSVIYTPGIDPGNAGIWAAGVLAVEYVKACEGTKCRLPSSVTSLARQGVSMEFSQGMFAGGATGIREVDAFVLSVNPNHLVKPPLVWSPDLPPVRFTTGPDLGLMGPFAPDFTLQFAVETP